MKLFETKILNSEGNPITLTEREKMIADRNQRIVNDLGHQIDITTLTALQKRIVEQKFFEIAPADFIPVRVGEGAWAVNLTTFRSFNLGGAFEEGNINSGANNTQLASADAGVDAVTVKIQNWAKTIGWTLFDLEQATRSNNWDLVTMKEKARKTNWDLGIQRVAFLGLDGNTSFRGLLNQAGVTNNTTRITKKLSSMTSTELVTFVSMVLGDYRDNCAHTAWPTHFSIPESDYLGLAAPSDSQFHIKSKLAILEETFRTLTKNQNFQILPLAYADSANNTINSGVGVTRYALYKYDEDSIRMDIPVDYQNTLANTVDNFSFQNVGYGQYTGVFAYRPKELLYYSF